MPLNILFVAAESAPFVKVGGLGDVVGSLPPVLRRLGHAVRVIIPHHGAIDDTSFDLRSWGTFDMIWNADVTHVEVASAEYNDTLFYFVRGWPFFAPHETFIYHDNTGIDIGRFLFFCTASLELTRLIADKEGWVPDLFHIHDWHTSPLPFLLARVNQDDPILAQAPTLLSIHNIQHQGWGLGWHLYRAGLPIVDHPLLHATGKVDCTLAVGLAYSTILSTVSPRYAQEIMSPEEGYGLDGLIHTRSSRLTGILNGIDTDTWNPRNGRDIHAPYDENTLEKRALNKRMVQQELGLPVQDSTPLVSTVTRLEWQKGIDILIPAVRYMLANNSAQFILLGTGRQHYEEQARQLATDFPEQAAIRTEFDIPLSRRIYAGADIFLMPSAFEPCGIGQMLAMRYGAVPVVRETGGLADTVDENTGFLFRDFHEGALGWALGRALETYSRAPDKWQSIQRAGMQRDFSWERSARQYIDLYEQALKVRRNYAAQRAAT